MASNIKPIQSARSRYAAPAQAITRKYRASDLAELLGVSVSTIWRWNAQGRLPKGRPLSPGVTVWDSDEIDAWLAGPKAA